MDGIHDMGGMQGFGPVDIEADEPVFHHDWERRVFALAMAAPFVAGFGDDQLRRQIESIAPPEYLSSSYYELWLEGLIRQLRELRILEATELSREKTLGSLTTRFNPGDQAQADGLFATVLQGDPHALPKSQMTAHRFGAGDRVRTRSHLTSVHNRLPRYARGKLGVVVAEHGCFIFADSNSVGAGLNPQMLYTIEFDAGDLWGDETTDGDTVCLDLWDDYLDTVE